MPDLLARLDAHAALLGQATASFHLLGFHYYRMLEQAAWMPHDSQPQCDQGEAENKKCGPHDYLYAWQVGEHSALGLLGPKLCGHPNRQPNMPVGLAHEHSVLKQP